VITPAEKDVLIEKWGQPRVEHAMVTLDHAVDTRGILQPAEVTWARVEALLSAIYEEKS